MGLTFAEKLLGKYGEEKEVVPGQIVTVHPDHLLTHDNTAAIISKIKPELEEYGIHSKSLSIIVLDHVIPAASEKTATNHKMIREFVKTYDVENFFDVGCGICHQLVVEKGFALPGKLILGSDSHTCSYGAVGAFSSGIDRTEAASLMLTGETWLKVPNSIKIILRNKFSIGVFAKDLILKIIGDISASGANYCSVEYHGDVENLSIDDRFTISNMGIESSKATTIEDPIYEVDGIIHYAVDHTPALFYKTASEFISSVVWKYVDDLVLGSNNLTLENATCIKDGIILNDMITRFQKENNEGTTSKGDQIRS